MDRFFQKTAEMTKIQKVLPQIPFGKPEKTVEYSGCSKNCFQFGQPSRALEPPCPPPAPQPCCPSSPVVAPLSLYAPIPVLRAVRADNLPNARRRLSVYKVHRAELSGCSRVPKGMASIQLALTIYTFPAIPVPSEQMAPTNHPRSRTRDDFDPGTRQEPTDRSRFRSGPPLGANRSISQQSPPKLQYSTVQSPQGTVSTPQPHPGLGSTYLGLGSTMLGLGST